MAKSQKLTITHPPEYIAAWRHAASRDRLTLAEWMAEHLNAVLPPEVRDTLPPRPKMGRPEKSKVD